MFTRPLKIKSEIDFYITILFCGMLFYRSESLRYFSTVIYCLLDEILYKFLT